MNIKITIVLLVFFGSTKAQTQTIMEDFNFYKQLPEASEEYTAGTVVSRMVDGLGFRYYWATEGLNVEDLHYQPVGEGRSSLETIEHVFSLSKIIVNCAKKQATDSEEKEKEMSFAEKRAATLQNFRLASKFFRKTKDLSAHKIIFTGSNGEREFPFWNQINGPIEDAIWHAGQIVLLRRSSGNPINPKVNMFSGKLRE